jgi:hypothetical protein
MSSEKHLREQFEKYPAEFAEASTFSDFLDGLEKHKKPLSDFYRSYVGGWADRLFLQDKRHGIGALWKLLLLPDAASWQDIFEKAQLHPYRGNPVEGFWFCSSCSAGDTAAFVNVGATYTLTEDGTRRVSGGVPMTTKVSPTPAVLDAWRTNISEPGKHDSEGYNPKSFDLFITSFEIFRRDDGFLVLANTRLSSRWLALIPLSEDFRALYSQSDLATIAQTEAAKKAAWGQV